MKGRENKIPSSSHKAEILGMKGRKLDSFEEPAILKIISNPFLLSF